MSFSDDDSIPPPPPPPPPLPPTAAAEEELEIQSTPVLERLKSGGRLRTDSRNSGRFSAARVSSKRPSPYGGGIQEVNIDSVEQGYAAKDENKSKTKKKKCILFLVVLLLIGGGVGAALGIILTKDKNTNASKGTGTDSESDAGDVNAPPDDGAAVDPFPIAETPVVTTPESYDEKDVAMAILRNILPTKAYTALSDPYIQTAQGDAFEWMMKEDEFVYDWDGLASTPVDPTARINLVQRYTAATLFISTRGGNWNNNEGWMGRMNVCTWFGVGCNENGVITSLSLSENNLRGPIPADLSTLGNLSIIEMHKNRLNGQLPSSIFKMSALKTLYLDENSLTGSISNAIGDLSNLEKLTLNDNQLSGNFPVAIGSLLNLDMLWLYNNPGIVGNLPAGIGNCQKLSKCKRHDNETTLEMKASSQV